MKEADILKLQKKLNQEPFVKQSEYISKKQALKEQTEAMGTDRKNSWAITLYRFHRNQASFRLCQFRQHREDRENDQEEL